MERRPTLPGDMAVAGALAAVLGAARAWADRAALAALQLPDTDDAMRLQQVRDWLGGQRWADLSQHRLGTGVAMHWTRLADLGPAALIRMGEPVLGRRAAEVAAVALWPPMLFALALLLAARISRALGVAEARTAAVVAALAYPATTLFAPGRIDHHGLQVVLLLAGVLAALRGRGAALGLAGAASLVVGLEFAPLVAALGGWTAFRWVRTGARAPLFGLAWGGAASLVVARALFAPDAFAVAACDGFTLPVWRAALAACAGAGLLAASPPGAARARGGAAVLVGLGAAAVALSVAPGCADPYGGVDPDLRRLWLSRVGEAQSALAAPLAVALGYLGVGAAGLAASAWRWAETRRAGWGLVCALSAVSLAVACAQLRGAYGAAVLGAPALAAMVAHARAKGAVRLAAAWAASAGLLYPLAADALAPAGPPRPAGGCASPAALRRLAMLPPGLVVAPLDAGAAVLAATPHRVVGAPYHRDVAGDLAVLRFYMGSPARARAVWARWRPDYLLACPDMPGLNDGRSAARALARGRLAGWRRAGRLDANTWLFRTVPALPGAARPD